MSQVPYAALVDSESTCGSIITIDSLDFNRTANRDQGEYLCRICKNKLMKKQDIDHTPMDCLGHRCETLEAETVKLKDHDLKSRIQIKDLESKVTILEEAIQALTAPKQQQAAPFNFSSGQKLRNPFKKAFSVEVAAHEPEINYDNILPPKRSGSRERVGLFGSLGAASQYR